MTKEFKVAGRPLTFSFSMADWELMEDEICTVDELSEKLNKKGRIKIIYKLGALLAHDGHVTEDWLRANIQPNQLVPLARALDETIVKAMTRKETTGEGVQDVVLAELEKKADAPD